MAADPNGSTAAPKRTDRDASRREAELSRKTVEGSAGGGLVRTRVDGFGRVRGLEISPEIFEGRDPDLLADLVMAAVADGQRKAAELASPLEPGRTGSLDG